MVEFGLKIFVKLQFARILFGLTKPLVLVNPTSTGVDAILALEKVWTYDEKNPQNRYACIGSVDWSLFAGNNC